MRSTNASGSPRKCATQAERIAQNTRCATSCGSSGKRCCAAFNSASALVAEASLPAGGGASLAVRSRAQGFP
jgi:hypothetical protein